MPRADVPTNVRQLSRSHVILEATAFDPLTRTVGVVDLADGRFATFEASSAGRRLSRATPRDAAASGCARWVREPP